MSLGILADYLAQGYSTLREPEVRAALTGEEGFADKAGRAVISGDLLRRVMIALERELQGHSTALRFREIIVEGRLILNDLVFDRSLWFDDCEFRGPVEMRMLGCRTLAIQRCSLRASLDGRVMSLRGNLFLRKTMAAGPVIIRDCSVEGVVDCSDSSFNFSLSRNAEIDAGMSPEEHKGEAFGASRIRARALFWREVTLAGDGHVTFYDSEVGSLRDDLAHRGLGSWPKFGSLRMRGFTYVRKNAAPFDTHLAWLRLDERDFESNGRVLASCLEAASALDDATKLKIEIRRHANRSEPSRVRRWSRALYLRLQQLAFRPGWVLSLLAVLYVSSGFLAAFLQQHDWIVPIDGSVVANGCFGRLTETCVANGWVAVEGHLYALPRAFRHFSGFSYALDLIFPYRPGADSLLWGGVNIAVSLMLLAIRVVGLALQASLLWSLFGNRDSG